MPSDVVHANGIDLVYDTFGTAPIPRSCSSWGSRRSASAWSDEFCEDARGRGRFVVRFDNRDVG